jgi:outer membrane protein assembly factor BamB
VAVRRGARPGGSPAIADDGTIYVNSYLPPAVRAFNPDGTLKWSYKVADCCTSDVPSTPAIAADGKRGGAGLPSVSWGLVPSHSPLGTCARMPTVPAVSFQR